MPKFFTSFNVPPSLPEPACSKERDELIYDEVQDKLIKVGTIPFYEEIQSYYESTRLDHKIEQFRRGNSLALGVPIECDVDVTNVPTNLAEVLISRQKVVEEFNNLPEGIRELFGNSYTNFVGSLEDGSYADKLDKYARGIIKDSGNQSAGDLSQPGEGGSK